MKNNIIKIGIDPGLTGGISILNIEDNKIVKTQVFAMPTKKLIIGKGKNKKQRKQLDIERLIQLFSIYSENDVDFVIEKASVRLGQGAMGALTMGANWGFLRGMAAAYGFNQTVITPMTWKKTYPSIMQAPQTVQLKQLQSKLKAQYKKEKDKKVQKLADKAKNKIANKKRKDELKQKDKQIKRVAAQIKRIAKGKARQQACKLCPELADKFKKVGSDGLAQSLLVAMWSLNNSITKQETEQDEE